MSDTLPDELDDLIPLRERLADRVLYLENKDTLGWDGINDLGEARRELAELDARIAAVAAMPEGK